MTETKIVHLKTRTAEAQDSVTAVLEELLDKARDGEIVEVAVAAIEPDGSLNTRANQTENRLRQIGAVAQLLFDLCASQSQ